MRIPAEDAGAIVGRRGENIRDLERKTNTSVHLKDQGLDFAKEDVVATENTYLRFIPSSVRERSRPHHPRAGQ